MRNVDQYGTGLLALRRPSRVIESGNITYLAYKHVGQDRYSVEKIVTDSNATTIYQGVTPVPAAEITTVDCVELEHDFRG